jgi:hypothetical protein
MFIRLLFWAAILYLAYRVITMLVFGALSKPKENQIKGKPKNRALDLSGMDVEDAKYEEIKEKTKDSR